MKKIIVLSFCAVMIESSVAQMYQPNWQSLDSRPVPHWFTDAKFGIFIHWGVYAVPGWSSKGNYAEWYQQGLQTTDTARQRFHKAKFGMTWPMILKQNFSIPMNGQKFLNSRVQNILYLLPSIMMGLPYGQVGKQTEPGVLNGMQLMWVQSETYLVIFSKR